ncbi:MAG TPA: hypothetical protein VLQ65_11660 [Saliniramus sp.]|nr:hypothetical protein [Saliniramus sp.]
MMKSLRISLAFVASLFAGLALPQPGSAQFFDRPLPIDEILYAVEARGFEPISRPRLRGDVYVVEVIDPRGRRTSLSVDAYDGMIIGSVRPRGVAPVYRDPRPAYPPLVPFDPRPAFPDRSVRDLRDPSTRGLVDPGSSVRIERVFPRQSEPREGELRAWAVPSLPERGPVPPPRPPESAMAPDGDLSLPSELNPRRSAARPDATERDAAASAAAQTPEAAERAARQQSVRERTTPARQGSVARDEALDGDAEQEEGSRDDAPTVEARAPEPAPRRTAPPVARAEPPPRPESLLDDFTPDEIDQMDMYAPPPVR